MKRSLDSRRVRRQASWTQWIFIILTFAVCLSSSSTLAQTVQPSEKFGKAHESDRFFRPTTAPASRSRATFADQKQQALTSEAESEAPANLQKATVINALSLSSTKQLPPPADTRPAIPPPSLPEPQDLPAADPLQTPVPTPPVDRPQTEPAIEPSAESDSPPCLIPETPAANPLLSNSAAADTFAVLQFRIEGSTAFSCAELAASLENYLPPRHLSFVELLAARSAITNLYIENDYITSGAYLPEQQIEREDGVVQIRVVEGRIDNIAIEGNRRLSDGYLRSRLRSSTATPLNQTRLLNALRALQLNPLIDNIAAVLEAGVQPGSNLLSVQVAEANPFSAQVTSNNGRSPSVSSFRRGVGITHANLLGFGDALSVGYNNTDGSNSFDVGYTLPISPQDGTLSLNYGTESNQVIEPLFDRIDIETDSRYYQLTLRQPILRQFTQTSSQEFALSITAARTESQSTVDGIGSNLAPGSDSEGRTRISAIRFAQDWVQQNQNHVLALRSQFSFGIDAFDATTNEQAPDSRFFSWLGQFQWIALLDRSTGTPPVAPLLLVRTNVQLADQPLVSTEQFGNGGFNSVRGYRQDTLLTDNGVLASAEVRLPILRIPDWQTAVLLVPFADVGTGWNSGSTPNPSPDTLVSIGLGLQLIQADNFRARIDWGIPLVDLEADKRTWQENGVYFSIEFSPF